MSVNYRDPVTGELKKIAGNGDYTVALYAIADEFDQSKSYSVGDLVVYNYGLYKFTSAHTADDPWDLTEVTQTTVDDEKVSKVQGKGLSTEDYTPAEKTKLANIDLPTPKAITYNKDRIPLFGEGTTLLKMDSYYPNIDFNNFWGNNVWTDGDDIFFSEISSGVSYQYKLNRETGVWESITWNGFNNIKGSAIWTDGEDIFYDRFTDHYIYNKQNHSWADNSSRNSQIQDIFFSLWKDYSGNIFYTDESGNTPVSLVFNKSTKTWSNKTWNKQSSWPISGFCIWCDGYDIHYDSQTKHSILINDKWWDVTWKNPDGTNYAHPEFINQVITDGRIFAAFGNLSQAVILDPYTFTAKNIPMVTDNGVVQKTRLLNILNKAQYQWSDGKNIYCTTGQDFAFVEKLSDINPRPSTLNSL